MFALPDGVQINYWTDVLEGCSVVTVWMHLSLRSLCDILAVVVGEKYFSSISKDGVGDCVCIHILRLLIYVPNDMKWLRDLVLYSYRINV